MTRTVCFLSARNLGDAVIHADFVRSLVRYGYADRYIVWTFNAAAFAFADIPQCELVFSDFPMGATRNAFFKSGGRSFFSAAFKLRSLRIDETIELISDLRERFATRLLGTPVRRSLDWEIDHPFRRHSRMSRRSNSSWKTIPASTDNLYAAFSEALQALVKRPDAHFSPDVRWLTLSSIAAAGGTIGIHPSASVPHKLWPEASWAELIASIHAQYPSIEFTLFGAPAERGQLEKIASAVRPVTVEVACGSLGEFKGRLTKIAILIGLDSFSVHLAQSVAVPSVVLVGANNPRLFAPPAGKIVMTAGSCVYQPCSGRPRCQSTEFEYACMRSIAPIRVIERMSEGNLDEAVNTD